MTKGKFWLGLALGVPIGVAAYFAVVSALPALGANTWIVTQKAPVAAAVKKY